MGRMIRTVDNIPGMTLELLCNGDPLPLRWEPYGSPASDMDADWGRIREGLANIARQELERARSRVRVTTP